MFIEHWALCAQNYKELLVNSFTDSAQSWASIINKEPEVWSQLECAQEDLSRERFSPKLRAHIYNQDIPNSIDNNCHEQIS